MFIEEIKNHKLINKLILYIYNVYVIDGWVDDDNDFSYCRIMLLNNSIDWICLMKKKKKGINKNSKDVIFS